MSSIKIDFEGHTSKPINHAQHPYSEKCSICEIRALTNMWLEGMSNVAFYMTAQEQTQVV